VSRAAALGLVVAVLAGCPATHVHIFGAFRYDAMSCCLEDAAGVDVIDGPDPGNCAEVRCWISPASEVYVTDKACDAPPDYSEHTSDTSGPCVDALAAFQGKKRCGGPGSDGGCSASDGGG